MSYPIFKETQKFNHVWMWIVLLAASAVMIFIAIKGIYVQLMLGESYGTNPAPNSVLLITSIVSLVVGIGMPILFYFVKLETDYTVDGIRITFPPFIRKAKQFNWDEIDEATIRKYKPIMEYGGWGIRHGLKGKAYNTSGNMGLQLKFTNGK